MPTIEQAADFEQGMVLVMMLMLILWTQKTKFLEVIRNHLQVNCISPRRTVDLISIGDNDFEEYAALVRSYVSTYRIRNLRLRIGCSWRLGKQNAPQLHHLSDCMKWGKEHF